MLEAVASAGWIAVALGDSGSPAPLPQTWLTWTWPQTETHMGANQERATDSVTLLSSNPSSGPFKHPATCLAIK